MKRILCLALILFSLHASLFTLHAQAKLKNGMEADIVLGQPDFNSSAANNGGISARTFSSPRDAFSDGIRLYVIDRTNSRALIWNKIPTKNHTPADVVLGQPDFVSAVPNNGGIGANTLFLPFSITSDGQKLVITDFNNQRILIWNKIPTTNMEPADVVLGQPDFVSQAVGTTQSRVNRPSYVSISHGRLLMTSLSNNRTLIWNTIPTTSFAPADIVIGQPDFISNTIGTTQQRLRNPRTAYTDGQRFYLADTNNNRALIWNKIPTANDDTPADIVLGQENFTNNTAGAPSRTQTGAANTIYSTGEQLVTTDLTNHRVLIWNSIPTTSNAPADFVLGQPDFNSGAATTSRRGMSSPRSAYLIGGKLFVSESGNNRVLIFNISESKIGDLGPQFSQGKAVVGKVYWDWNANRQQDAGGIS